MMLFTGQGKAGTVYFVGLDRQNVNRLTNDQPIHFNLAAMGGPPAEVVLLFDETLRGLFDKLKAADMIPPGVEFRDAAPGVVEVQRVKREGAGG